MRNYIISIKFATYIIRIHACAHTDTLTDTYTKTHRHTDMHL